MPGVEEQCDVGPFRRPEIAFQPGVQRSFIDVDGLGDAKSEFAQRSAHVARVVGGIREHGLVQIGAVADDQRHACVRITSTMREQRDCARCE